MVGVVGAESFDCWFDERRVWPEEEEPDDGVGASSRDGHVAEDGKRELGERGRRVVVEDRDLETEPWLFEFLELWGSELRVVEGFEETRREASLGLEDGLFFGGGRRRRRRERGAERSQETSSSGGFFVEPS